MDTRQDNEMERGPILTPQVIMVLLFIIGIPVASLIFSRFVTDEKPSLWGKYKGDQSSREEVDELPNRKPEVDAAVEDVDFEKFDYQIELDTTLGTIVLDLWPEVAPGHCKNMIGLSRIGFYDTVIFHRVKPGFVAQAGDPLGTGAGGPGYTIPPEFNDRKHVAGVLSMARGEAPSSAGSQFFICLGPAPHLDHKYTAFGQIADQASFDVAMKFNDVDVDPRTDRPIEEIVIDSVQVIEKPKSGD